MPSYIDHVGDIFRVTTAFTYNDGQVEEFDIHYQVAVAGGGDSRAGVLSNMGSGVLVYLINQMPASASYYGSKISTIKALAPWGPKVAYDGTSGGDSGFELPTQVRGLISWKTALAGRAYRGRSYLPTPTVTFNTVDGGPTSTCLTAWAGFATFLQAPVVSGGSTWVPGIYHRVPTAVISSIFDQFTGATVSSFFATQRRSGRFGRPNNPPF